MKKTIEEKIKEEGNYYLLVYKGYSGEIIRQEGGHLCGYVYLDKKHPLYGVVSFEVEDKYNIDVHGGITYHKEVEIDDKKYRVLGFDCAYYGDFIPYKDNIHTVVLSGKTYKDLDYVNNELKSLIEQLAKMKKKEPETEHEKLKEICDIIGYENGKYEFIKGKFYRVDTNYEIVDSREIIFTSDFMKKAIYNLNIDPHFRKSLIYQSENLDNVVDFFYQFEVK